MKQLTLMSLLLAGALVVGGCATKKHVRQQIDPLETKVDQVAARTDEQGRAIEEVKSENEDQDRQLGAAAERIDRAEGRIGEVDGRTEQNARQLEELRQRVANLDDYQVASEGTVYFGFDRAELTAETQAELDRMVASMPQAGRYFVSVEGFTDPIGPPQYNLRLSRQRADNVVQYLVLNHNIPVHRIFVIGLGENRLVDEDRTREALAKNRRVEVRLYAADAASATASSNPD